MSGEQADFLDQASLDRPGATVRLTNNEVMYALTRFEQAEGIPVSPSSAGVADRVCDFLLMKGMLYSAWGGHYGLTDQAVEWLAKRRA